MKKLILILGMFFLMSSVALADYWCEWDGSKGVNCQSDSRGYISIPPPNGFHVRTEALANARGWYRVVTTQPVLGADQVRGAMIWDFDGTEISRTWAVRDLSATEIDERDAATMELDVYYIYKILLKTGVVTQQQALNNIPQEVIDAYLARDRLENP